MPCAVADLELALNQVRHPRAGPVASGSAMLPGRRRNFTVPTVYSRPDLIVTFAGLLVLLGAAGLLVADRRLSGQRARRTSEFDAPPSICLDNEHRSP